MPPSGRGATTKGGEEEGMSEVRNSRGGVQTAYTKIEEGLQNKGGRTEPLERYSVSYL